MADAHKEEPKKDAVKAPEAAPIDYAKIIWPLFWIFSVVIILFVSYYLILINEELVLNFIKFLNILIVLLGLYFVFQVYKFIGYTYQFQYWSDKIGAWYGAKYKPDVKNPMESVSQNRVRFEKAKMHISSRYKEEWKIGVIELDNILRDLLKLKNYAGETVADLLKSGDADGMKTIDIAWEAHSVRNRIVHEGTKYDFSKEEADKVLRKYSTVFEELGI